MGELILPALSIRQPWCWAILHAGKDIENRTWTTAYRGRLLLHAGKAAHRNGVDYLDDVDYLEEVHGLRPPDDLDRGGIVGVAQLVDVVTRSASPWYQGPYGFVLRDVRPLAFVPYRGALGLFDVTIRSELVLPATLLDQLTK